MTEPIYLSLIIPAYNAADILEKNLTVLLNYINRQPFLSEVIIVDDGSDDHGATEKIAKNAGCVFLRNHKNMGKGAAVRNGMKHASGKFRIFTDADIPYELGTIENMLIYLDEWGCEMVVGDRTMQGSCYFLEISKLRRLTSLFFSWFVGTIVTSSFFDTQCGIKGFHENSARFIFDHCRINGFAFDVEVLYIALKQKMEIKRIPVKSRNQGKSTVHVFKHGIIMFFDLFRIKFFHCSGCYKKSKQGHVSSSSSTVRNETRPPALAHNN